MCVCVCKQWIEIYIWDRDNKICPEMEKGN